MSGSDQPVDDLYARYIRSWNAQDGAGIAELFTNEASLVGFDGSSIDGREQIEDHLSGVFADHETASYVGKRVRIFDLAPGAKLLRAVAGMVPPGGDDINPNANAIHAVVAVDTGEGWRIAHFQATPAAFHGRPEETERLTEELRQELRAGAER